MINQLLEIKSKIKINQPLIHCITNPISINDCANIVLALGVHVGQSDIPVYYARKLMGKEKIVGATTKTVEQALEAYNQGADYLGVGAIFPTTTKVVTRITEV